MFETFENTLAVQVGWLIDEEIISLSNYKALCYRNILRVLRRGCKATPALIEYNSIPAKFKQQIVDKVGDPHKAASRSPFLDALVNDLEAVKYFNDFTLENGTGLPQKNIAEYTANACILNAVHKVISERISKRKSLGGKTTQIWENVINEVQDLPLHTYPNSLPTNVRRFRQRYKSYLDKGFANLVHKNFGNNNSEKINDDAGRWLINRYADRVNKIATTSQLFMEYNHRAEIEGWKFLKDESTIYNYLHQEEIVHLWYGHRHGELKSKEKFAYQHSTKMPSMRDSLWYSDGTKLNYYYLNADGKIETCQVYEVMDAFSEVLLGFHISKTEDFESQFSAYRMAVKNSGHRPYQLGFDGQGGHKKLQNGQFLTKLARLSIKTQPYNGKSKTIESAFGRLQSQYLKRDWFFTGMNIQTKEIESKANMEFIMANKNNLPTLAEVKATYEQRRSEWNSAPHFKTGLPRIEMYRSSANPQCPKVEMWDMIDLFWIQRPAKAMMTAYGITIKEKNVSFTYMAKREDGLPNVDWLKRNIDKKFIVKYDPDDMSFIQLYEDDPLGPRHAMTCELKTETHRNRQEQEEWEAEYLTKVNELNRIERMKSAAETDAILEEHGALPEQQGLISPKLKGIKGQKGKSDDFGSYVKKASNITSMDEDDEPTSLASIY